MTVQLTMRANGHVESFHGRLRDECLNVEWFGSLHQARERLAEWRDHYNLSRPTARWTINRQHLRQQLQITGSVLRPDRTEYGKLRTASRVRCAGKERRP